ncbi:MAG: ATP-binding cassette domain-containing protein [Leptospiraceae bacterium]|nr:ATP-binding cassette domain-containing protein [Leptospiraceae bacterium]
MTQKKLDPSRCIGWLIPFIFVFLILFFYPNPLNPDLLTFIRKFHKILFSSIWADVFVTTARVFVAFLLALGTGISFSALLSSQRPLEDLLKPSLLLLHASPVIFWIIPLVLFVGRGDITVVLSVAIVALPVVFMEFHTAERALREERREFWKHYAPQFRGRLSLRLKLDWLPQIENCISVGFPLSFKAAVIAEWFGAHEGLGRRLQSAFLHVDLAAFLSYAILFLLASLSVAALLRSFFYSFSQKMPEFNRIPQKKLNLSQLKAEKISFCYAEKWVLHKLSLELKKGEWILLQGDSGVGKSTLAKLLAGILKPQGGYVRTDPPDIAFLFQSNIIFPAHSVFDNVSFYLNSTQRNNVNRVLKELQLDGHTKAALLSGGMQRRVCLARALVHPGSFLILDEPFVSLDDKMVQKILFLLRKEKQKGRTIFLISHEYEKLIAPFCDKHYVLRRGKLYPKRVDKI